MKLGIIGGGQLGQMLAQAAIPLGIKVICYEKTKGSPAGLVTKIFVGDYEDVNKFKAFASNFDAITYEFENVSVKALEAIGKHPPIYPNVSALFSSQDRIKEKTFFNDCGIPTAKFKHVNSPETLKVAVEEIGLPGILKTCRFGYDGKGQYLLEKPEDIQPAWEALSNQPLIYEQKIDFEREVSMLGVRGKAGEIVFYPLTENQHHQGILASSIAPYVDKALTQQAQDYMERVLIQLNYVGVLAIEFFVKNGQLLANEMAPRVHNSGHWTIEGAHCSQFENHIRAVCGLPLGNPQALGYVAMINIIGKRPDFTNILKIPNTHLHWYGKESRPKRKLGHVTLIESDYDTLITNLTKLKAIVFNPGEK